MIKEQMTIRLKPVSDAVANFYRLNEILSSLTHFQQAF